MPSCTVFSSNGHPTAAVPRDGRRRSRAKHKPETVSTPKPSTYQVMKARSCPPGTGYQCRSIKYQPLQLSMFNCMFIQAQLQQDDPLVLGHGRGRSVTQLRSIFGHTEIDGNGIECAGWMDVAQLSRRGRCRHQFARLPIWLDGPITAPPVRERAPSRTSLNLCL